MFSAYFFKIVLSTLSAVVGVIAITHAKELVQIVYGGFLKEISKHGEYNWLRRYYYFTIVSFGICALIFALFNITGPINDW